MKAWRQHPRSDQGKYVNRRAARRTGSINRNSFFTGGSALLRTLILYGEFAPPPMTKAAKAQLIQPPQPEET